mmetsp:Transcript_9018/g.12400  ORF Transcript_9018/g.12400 Transcript_9018/m.12400 type:complete len:142 (+) Transcript_9018:46-471(+)|eukprot:CAMPEP_0168548382 /NCGR_PEP_ID=MMETSP0413-20121227/4528_1 /TAXON_ID=136452 /ORGANISM="Filamoeba nolandi, Strain NC-AS-23-1" /LENGTH=141 /DNA_ID=CAMNT_0008578675 /DNA_START=12 /DNA_END=437 /DNA_ORIENTATION=+
MASQNTVEKLDVPTPSEFDSLLSQAIKSNGSSKPVLVLFSGDIDPQTNQSWCPDCVQADETLPQYLKDIPSYTLLKCWISRSEYKGNPKHPYRVHPKINLKAIPTLIRYSANGNPREVLVEEECYNVDLVKDFVESVNSKK